MIQQAASQSNRLTSIVQEVVLILVMLGVLIATYYTQPININVTVVLVLGAWMIDAFIKHTYHFRNETLFADFSFGSFLFIVGQGISLLTSNLIIDVIIRMTLLAFFMFMLWIGNLALCRWLIDENGNLNNSTNDENHTRSIFLIKVVSLILAIFSLCGTLYPQITHLI